MQSMEKLRQAGFSEDQSRAQTDEAVIKMYDAVTDRIDQIGDDLMAEFKAVGRRIERRYQRSDMIMVAGFIGIIITVIASAIMVTVSV